MLRKYEENLIKLTSANISVTNQHLDALRKELTDLKEKLKFTQNNTEDNDSKFKEKLTAVERD